MHVCVHYTMALTHERLKLAAERLGTDAMTPTDLLLVRGVVFERLALMSTQDIDSSVEVGVPLHRAAPVNNHAAEGGGERELSLVPLARDVGGAGAREGGPPEVDSPPPYRGPGRDISALVPPMPYHAQRALPIQMHPMNQQMGPPPGLGGGPGGQGGASERPHQWGPISQFPDAGSNHHGTRCMSCGAVRFYGTRYGSNKHPGFSYVDPICPGRRYPW